MSYKRQELLTLREHLNSRFFCGVRVAYLFSFFALSCYVSLLAEFRGVMSATISAKNDVRFRAHVLFTLFVVVCV